MQYSEKIRLLRDEKGITQKELSRIVGMSPQTISKWEKGEVQLDFNSISKLCEYFDVSADFLLGRSEVRNAEKMIDLHSAGIMVWINDKAFSKEDSAVLKENYDELLFRYKELINAAANKLKYNEEWRKLVSGGASLEELARYSCNELKSELRSIISFVAAFPYHLNSRSTALQPEKLNLLFDDLYETLGVLHDSQIGAPANLTDDERAILDLWSKLDLDGKRVVLGTATEQKQRGEKDAARSQNAG